MLHSHGQKKLLDVTESVAGTLAFHSNGKKLTYISCRSRKKNKPINLLDFYIIANRTRPKRTDDDRTRQDLDKNSFEYKDQNLRLVNGSIIAPD